MRSSRKLTGLTASAALAAGLLAAPAGAATIVFDPTNHLENALQAARSLESLANQARQLANDARMLARSPLAQAGEIGRALAAIDQLTQEVNGLTSDAAALERQFKTLYGEASAGEKLQMLQQSLSRLKAARDTAQDLARVAARPPPSSPLPSSWGCSPSS